MTPGDPGGAPRWLEAEEMDAWLGLLAVVMELPQALDRQLRGEAGIGHVYYSILAVLSGSPEGQSPLRELARTTGTSLSRLSHALDVLERNGWVLRCPSTGGRALARLTDAGRALLARTAPGHVAEVRRLVFDRLSSEDVRALARITARLRPLL